MMTYSDFRSDTVTKPTDKMRKAMAEAVVGDDVLGDDPTVQRLEAMAAEVMGKEAGLFCPSGTMGNSIAVKIWTNALEEVIVEERSHIYNMESTHMTFISGVGIPVEGRNFYIEPFTWFFHHSNQRAYLDLSGERLQQEYGLRASVWTKEGISAHAQAVFQTVKAFSFGQAFMGELIIRLRLALWLELSLGGSVWTDIEPSALGVKQSFHKLSWGIAVPF